MAVHSDHVHHGGGHVARGHPRLIAALQAQPEDLPLARRRFTFEPAVARG
jgi:hypothetical protein